MAVMTDQDAAAELLPVFVKLERRKVVLVGGGRVAAAKLPALLRAGARVTVVAPEIAPDIVARPVAVCRRPFEPGDLDGCWLAVAAAPAEVNRQVATAAEARHVLVNAVDDPAHATAYAGAVLRRGDVTVAISTNGHAPALAGLLHEAFEALLPDDVHEWVETARRLRREWKRDRTPMGARRPILLRVLWKLYRTRRHALTSHERPDQTEDLS